MLDKKKQIFFKNYMVTKKSELQCNLQKKKKNTRKNHFSLLLFSKQMKLESPSHTSTISNVLKSGEHGSLSANSSTDNISSAEQLRYENERLKLALAQRLVQNISFYLS